MLGTPVFRSVGDPDPKDLHLFAGSIIFFKDPDPDADPDPDLNLAHFCGQAE